MGGRVVASSDGAIYVGDVVHKRSRPKRHALRYRVFSLLVDLEQLDELDKNLRLFSVDKFNFVSFVTKDFGARDGTSLASFIRHKASIAGIDDIAKIRMLAYPRLFGYAFNPITVYFCEDASGVTKFIAYEVSNTFGDHHFYQAIVDATDAQIHHQAKKAFFVSPFNTLDGNYRFSIRPPAENVFLGITLSTEEGGLLTAYFDGARRDLTDFALVKLLLAYPFMTAKVMFGIHWEALRLYFKGVPMTLKYRRQLKSGTEPGDKLDHPAQ